jgi:hypothetical protein
MTHYSVTELTDKIKFGPLALKIVLKTWSEFRMDEDSLPDHRTPPYPAIFLIPKLTR